jgi:ABC-type transporter Mla MlaB component
MAVPAPDHVVFEVHGPIARTDLPGLCNRVRSVLRECAPGDVLCDVRTVEPDCVAIDALARLQLAARRNGCRVRLCNASPELLDLVTYLGLNDVLAD